MRALLLPVMFGMLSSAALAQDAGLPLNPPPRLTIEKPAAGDVPSGPDAPVLESITWRALVRTPGGRIMDLVPNFHFQAPKGNAVMLRRELVDTNGNFAQTQIASATINTPAEAQKKGAVISGGWMCGTAQYYVTLRAYVMDADGKRSNALRYTLHCNGG